ncbi:MAG: hypothetical protein ACR2OX_00465 [Methyloligellaceae bacterium]
MLAVTNVNGDRIVQQNPPLRPGQITDAPLLAELVNYAGEGLPHYLWSEMTEPGERAWDVGRRRARREDGGFSYLNATMIESRVSRSAH